jgi:hypothetical protein
VQSIPSGYSTLDLNDAAGGQQIGTAKQTLAGANHAVLFQSGALTDLHPSGFTASEGNGTDGVHQVGQADGHAILWSGTAGSAVDLHPTGYVASSALAVSGNQQGGQANQTGEQPQPILWTGTAASATPLTPVGFAGGAIFGMDASRQVGIGLVSSVNSVEHAFVWQGTIASAIDLNPAGSLHSSAQGTGFGFIFGDSGTTADELRATIWTGNTAGSAFDLQQFLSSDYSGSQITGVDASGNFYGIGFLAAGGSRAIEWINTGPIPEPAGLSFFGLLLPLLRRKPHRSQLVA